MSAVHFSLEFALFSAVIHFNVSAFLLALQFPEYIDFFFLLFLLTIYDFQIDDFLPSSDVASARPMSKVRFLTIFSLVFLLVLLAALTYLVIKMRNRVKRQKKPKKQVRSS